MARSVPNVCDLHDLINCGYGDWVGSGSVWTPTQDDKTERALPTRGRHGEAVSRVDDSRPYITPYTSISYHPPPPSPGQNQPSLLCSRQNQPYLLYKEECFCLHLDLSTIHLIPQHLFSIGHSFRSHINRAPLIGVMCDRPQSHSLEHFSTPGTHTRYDSYHGDLNRKAVEMRPLLFTGEATRRRRLCFN